MTNSRIFTLILAILLLVPALLVAGTWGWGYSDYSNGSYVPKSGTFSESFSSGYLAARIDFGFDSHNASSIDDYIAGDSPSTNCDGSTAYVSIDHTADPDSWDLEIDAVGISTNLPNPKKDLDGGFWAEAHEAEVTAQTSVATNSSYYMKSYWDDFRDGDADDSGDMHVQFGMAKWGLSEYNDCINANGPQVINSYGDNHGDL